MTARRLAAFCLATGIPPSEAKQLTRLEREEFSEQHRRIAEQMKRK